MKAYYDLSQRPATFDFITFLVTSKTLGATEVIFNVSKGFQKKKFSQDIARQMYENVLQPACELWGVKFSEGFEGDFSVGHMADDLLSAYEKTGMIAPPDCKDKGSQKYTITIRDSIRNKHRDSNRAAWEKFAKDINAYLIEDAYIKPISMFERFALYNGADMNFFTSNGPSVMCVYSHMPYTLFSPPCADESWPKPIGPGFQMPFRNQNQKIVWKADSYENIAESFNR